MRLPRNLGREIFIPARDSRHRIAVFALYRALLRAADRVSLPPDEFSIGIPQLIRRQFRRNAHEVSSRLSFAALTAGYKVRRSPHPDSLSNYLANGLLPRLSLF